MTQEQKEKFLTLACSLSPENLTCDGELSNAQVRIRHRELMKKWRELEREVGRAVSEEEAYSFYTRR
jgi:hypothetical protein